MGGSGGGGGGDGGDDDIAKIVEYGMLVPGSAGSGCTFSSRRDKLSRKAACGGGDRNVRAQDSAGGRKDSDSISECSAPSGLRSPTEWRRRWALIFPRSGPRARARTFQRPPSGRVCS